MVEGKVMRKLSKEEYYAENPELLGQCPEFDSAVYFYLSVNEECPCICVEYEDGTVWVYGARYDRRIQDADEMEYYLSLR